MIQFSVFFFFLPEIILNTPSMYLIYLLLLNFMHVKPVVFKYESCDSAGSLRMGFGCLRIMAASTHFNANLIWSLPKKIVSDQPDLYNVSVFAIYDNEQ